MRNRPERQIEGMEWLDRVSTLLDNRFRIPGTNIRFGADALIGLIPYFGDILSFGISSTLVLTMARKGASGMVLVKMVWNVIVDTLVGSIPILGDIFDVTFRANVRNLNLLKEHYEEGRHQGSAWWVLVLIALVLIGVAALTVYLVWQFFAFLF